MDFIEELRNLSARITKQKDVIQILLSRDVRSLIRLVNLQVLYLLGTPNLINKYLMAIDVEIN